MQSTESTRVVRNDEIPTGEIDGEIVALDTEAGNCFAMDQVGATIWHIAAEPISVGDIADRLVEAYEVEREECVRDILPFVDDMLSAGLLRRAD